MIKIVKNIFCERTIDYEAITYMFTKYVILQCLTEDDVWNELQNTHFLLFFSFVFFLFFSINKTYLHILQH